MLGDLGRRRLFHSFFEFSETFNGVTISRKKNRDIIFSISLRKHTDEIKAKQLVIFKYQNVNSLCSRHHFVDGLCYFCVSIELQKDDFKPIRECIFKGLLLMFIFKNITSSRPLLRLLHKACISISCALRSSFL